MSSYYCKTIPLRVQKRIFLENLYPKRYISPMYSRPPLPRVGSVSPPAVQKIYAYCNKDGLFEVRV